MAANLISGKTLINPSVDRSIRLSRHRTFLNISSKRKFTDFVVRPEKKECLTQKKETRKMCVDVRTVNAVYIYYSNNNHTKHNGTSKKIMDMTW